MPQACRIAFEGRWLVRLERQAAGVWQPVDYQGRDFDDVEQVLLIQRLGGDGALAVVPASLASGPGWEMWVASFELPEGLAVAGLLVAVAPRGDFGGFAIGVQ